MGGAAVMVEDEQQQGNGKCWRGGARGARSKFLSVPVVLAVMWSLP